jgi:hypothetical protein
MCVTARLRNISPPFPFRAGMKIRTTLTEQPTEGILGVRINAQVRFNLMQRDIAPVQVPTFHRCNRRPGTAAIWEAIG